MRRPELWLLFLVVTHCTHRDAPAPPAESPLSALTPTEYNATVRDLLGLPDDATEWPSAPPITERLFPGQGLLSGLFESTPVAPSPWPWPLPEEVGVDGLEGMADGQEPSAYRIEELQKAALHFASFTLVSPTFFSCGSWDELDRDDQAACSWASLERFAQRAWRRPLTASEYERLLVFWGTLAQDGPADEAIVLTAAGILQAPQFVFRIERGDLSRAKRSEVPLTDWELASRLSYFLWDTMPDAALFAAADNGELSTTDGVRTHTRRMLDDPRARAAVTRFHTQWLGTEGVHTIAPSRRTFGPQFGLAAEPPLDTTGDGDWPAVLGPIRHSMDAELRLLVEDTIFEGAGTLTSLLSRSDGFSSSATIPIYGEDAVITSDEFIPWRYGNVTNSQGYEGVLQLFPTRFSPTERAGLLTQPAVLAVGAYTVHPAPILRGQRILERLTCMDFPPPPPGAEGAAPPDIPEATSTNRERTESATSPSECLACHDTLNPPGFAFEHYDAMGGWRDTDNDLPVSASGSLTLPDGQVLDFRDGVDLAQQLSTSASVHDCYALRWMRYATGVHLDPDDPHVAPLQAGFRRDSDIRALLESITTSDLFRNLWMDGATR